MNYVLSWVLGTLT